MLQGKMTYVGIAQLVASLIVLSPLGQEFSKEELEGAMIALVNAVAVVMSVVGTFQAFYGRFRIYKARYRNPELQ